MYRILLPMAIVMMVAFGCASPSSVAPEINNPDLKNTELNVNNPHRLWGEWTWYINEDHDRIDVVPKRESRFHLNTLKFLESYCTDCVKIIKIKKNGDGTIDATVRITHPFPDNPEFTGFDVKGIIIFKGSHELEWNSKYVFPFSNPARVSWKELGDPELLNPDGFTPYWCPEWDSGSSAPIFNYYPGKYSHGTPTANINAFINFYTDEERHMFRVGKSVEKVYHIWLPSGSVALGYAVDACWEPPISTPVLDPINDFPVAANQPEAYHFKYVINAGNPITEASCCGTYTECANPDVGCKNLWVEKLAWSEKKPEHGFAIFFPHPLGYPQVYPFDSGGACLSDPPGNPEWQCTGWAGSKQITELWPNGKYRGAACIHFGEPYIVYTHQAAYDVFDFTIDIK
jgi:hypothetical protein